MCIICEGDEEYDYLERLNAIGERSNVYKVTLDNACGNGNIPARYQDRFQNGSYDIVLIFCDTEKKPYEQYEDIKQKLMQQITVENYRAMYERVRKLKNIDTVVGSSNFDCLIDYLSSDDTTWIEQINTILEK